MKFITVDNLSYAMQKVGSLFVKKELKTGSDSEYKQLSDNNLTDDLVEKINSAGSATAVTEEIGEAKTEAIDESKSYTDDQIQSFKDNVTDELSSDISGVSDRVTTIEGSMATDTELSDALAEAKEYADTAETDAIATSKSYTDDQLDATKTELQAEINSKISTAYKVKGSSAFASLPALSATEEGNVYNLTDEFTTTDDFVEGKGKKYPVGTNVVCVEVSEGVFKWDALPGFIDTDSFVLNSDIETVTEDEIDAMFTAA